MTTDDLPYVRKLLEAAKAEQFTFQCYYEEDELDYEGTDIDEAIKALGACDQMQLVLKEAGRTLGWALIVPSLEDDEVLADFAGGFINKWFQENVA